MNVSRIATSRSGLTRRYSFEVPSSKVQPLLGSAIAHFADEQKSVTVSAPTLIGCPYRCCFCAQGQKDPQPLFEEEVVSVIEAVLLDCRPAQLDGVRFDVSGEPLVKWPTVKQVIQQLSANYPSVDLLLVSAGPDVKCYRDLFALGSRLENFKLQFSVHASTEDERSQRFQEDRLMTLVQISRKGEEWAQITGRRCLFTYAVDGLGNAHPGVADRLSQLFPPELWECQITPTYVQAAGGPRALGVSQLPQFQQELQKHGYDVSIYAPLDGLEIQAVPGLD